MKLRIICGRAGSGKSYKCIEEISASLGRKEGSSFLIVPEQFMLNAERRLLLRSGCAGLMGDEVLSFRRLQYKVMKEAGAGMKPEADPVICTLVLIKTLTRIYPDLRYYSKTGISGDTVHGILAQINEFERYRVTFERLFELSEDADTEKYPGFKDKLCDLGLIYREYKKLLSENYSDSQDAGEKTLAVLKEKEIFKGSRIWIDEFHGFTGLETGVIEELIRQAECVTVCLSMPGKGDSKGAVFESSVKTYNKLRRIAGDLGASFEEIRCSEDNRYRGNKYLSYLEKNLFSYPFRPVEETPDSIFITECQNPFDETVTLAEDIRKKAEGGLKYSDISVIVTDPELYGSIAEAVFPEYGIPYFTDRKKDLHSHPYAVGLKHFISLCIDGWKTENMLAILRSGIYRDAEDGEDYLELYLKKTGITGKRAWKRKADRTVFEGMKQNARGIMYESAENVRKRLCEDAEEFEEIMSSGKSPGDIAKKIYEFSKKKEFLESLSETCAAIYENGDIEGAGDFLRKAELVNDILADIYKLLSEDEFPEECTVREKAERMDVLFRCCLSECKTGRIPGTYERVQIGTKERSRSHETETVYLLGANDGLLPKPVSSNGILSDSERTFLEEKGAETAGNDREMAVSEQFLIYTVLSLPRRELNISYSLNGMDGARQEPSRVVERVRSLFPKVTVTKENSDAAWEYEEMEDGSLVTPGEWDRLFVKDGVAGTSFSAIEEFGKCPYKYYLDRKLGIVSEEDSQITDREYGTAIHEVLCESVKRAVKEKGRDILKGMSKSECMKYVEPEVRKTCLRYLGNVRNEEDLSEKVRYIMERMKNSAAECMSQSLKYGIPVGFEEVFDKGKDIGDIYFDLKDEGLCDISIRGKIDRFDLAEGNGEKEILTVIDYKKKSSDSKDKDKMAQLELYSEILRKYYEDKKEKDPEAGEIGDVRLCNIFYDSRSEETVKEYGEKDLAEAGDAFKEKIYDFARAMGEKDFRAAPERKQNSHCEYCDYNMICKAMRKKKKEKT